MAAQSPASHFSGTGGDIDDANYVADASAALKSHDNFYRAILDAAISYIRQGFAIVPVPYRQKGPIIEGWQNLRITAEDAPRYFNAGPQNIGVIQGHASGGLTDIDLDCQEATAAAPYLLPKTNAFGHASKRASHWIYKTNLAEIQDRAAIKFMSAGKSGLLEVRAGGGGFAAQTIFPPSTHISGELIKWEDGNDEILEIDGAELLACANQLAAAAQLAIAYPKIGARHDAAFVLGGFLSRCNLISARLSLFVEAVAVASGQPLDKRRDMIRTAADGAACAKPAGFHLLSETFSASAAEKCAEWLSYRDGNGKKRKRADEEGQARPGAPFVMKPSGLYGRDLEGEASDLFLAGPFEILAETRDLDGCSWGLLLQWEDRDGRVKTWAMPKSLLAGDGVDVRRALLDRGLAIASGTKARNLLTNYLVSQRSDERARAVPTTGWHHGQFVFPNCSVGKADGERCFFQTEHSFAHDYNVRGTVQDWKENVARFAVGNSRLAFSISTSVAAILINACGIESGGFHFRGASSIGKSTALLAAGSVWGGGGRNGFLTSWRATSNALEGVAVTHNDALVCLDELSLLAARDASESAYMLANGSGKSRAARNGSLRKPAEWALLFLSSGEIGLAEKIAEDLRGRRQTAGQEVRFVDIPADTGEHGLFENLHGFPSSQAFADHLRNMARENYGAAARAFIEAVTSDLDKVAAAIKQGAKSFIKDHCPEGADFQVQRVANRFGFVAAVGELAIASGVLPWPGGEAAKAAKICFEAWLAARGGAESAEIRNGICAIRDFVSAHGTSRFSAAWEPAPTNFQGDVIQEKVINLAGYRKNVGNAWDFYFTPGAWREALTGLDPRAIAKALAEKGLLEPENERHLGKSTNVPGCGKQRLYHIKACILELGS